MSHPDIKLHQNKYAFWISIVSNVNCQMLIKSPPPLLKIMKIRPPIDDVSFSAGPENPNALSIPVRPILFAVSQ
jgi:hypothetical protein